ncbi:MAG TPA: T9SS type A sorting domain-containing protein [Bacteroidia bacterium]|nr:T9SS type A sorting domain-containing protein [Bacteroidia bacterium]
MKKSSLFFVLILLSFFKVNATHLMGGEITWHCQGNGTYIFKMKLYRDCTTPVYLTVNGPISIRVHNHPSVLNIPMNIVDSTDISPVCNSAGPGYNCTNMYPGNVATKEYILESAPINLPGIPPAQGWIFSWSNCCRNAAITNLNLTYSGPGNPTNGMTLRAIMFPFNGQNASNCFDSAPDFLQPPSIITCAGSQQIYNAGAIDTEGDSLEIEFDHPLDYLSSSDSFTNISPPTVPFENNYSFNSPFPGNNQNPNNIPAQLNQQTGELTFTSYNVGNFVNVIKATSYRCGQKTSEIYREIQTTVLSCGANTPPNVIVNGLSTTLSNYTYIDTVLAGDLVSFSIQGIDPGFLANGHAQSIIIEPKGLQFGMDFINSNIGCPNPPCATLGSIGPYSDSLSVSVDFNWQTTCNHVIQNPNCPVNYTLHKFLFNVKDDYCPAPSNKMITVMIVVKSTSNTIPVITFDGVYLNSTPGLSYHWYLNGALLPNDTTQSIIPIDSGSYTVQVLDKNLCTNTSLPNIVTSISDYVRDQIHCFSIYPSPANEYFYIKSNENINQVMAYSITGQKINLVEENKKVVITNLSSGFYIIEITGVKHTERLRLLKY